MTKFGKICCKDATFHHFFHNLNDFYHIILLFYCQTKIKGVLPTAEPLTCEGKDSKKSLFVKLWLHYFGVDKQLFLLAQRCKFL